MGLNISSIRVFDQIRDPEIPITLRPLNIHITYIPKVLEWAGPVTRMENKRIPLKIMQTELGGRRTVGRPKNRWMDVVERDVR